MQFVLEPFYKIISVSISEEKEKLEPILKKNKILLKNSDYNLDIKPLIRLVLRKLLGDLSCLVDSLRKLPDAEAGTRTKVAITYPGDRQLNCNAK